MYLSDQHKAVVLQPHNPDVVTSVVHTAQPLPGHPGHLAIPHRLSETKILRNLGYDVPSPIVRDYAWPGQFTPFAAQLATASFMSLYNRAFNFSDMGTGKTMASLWAYDYLRSLGLQKKLLVISPLSTLNTTWGASLFTHMSHLKYEVVHGSRAKRQKILADTSIDVYISNHHGAPIIADMLKSRTDITLVVIDEVDQVARNHKTQLWKSLNVLVNGSVVPRSCWAMTGTPTPESPLNAWAQSMLVRPGLAPRTFSRFRQEVMYQAAAYKWLPRDNAMERVKEILSPSIRFTLEDCVDLPPCIHEERHVVLTPDQTRAYDEAVKTLLIRGADGTISAVEEKSLWQKLIQIVCGNVYTKTGNDIRIPSNSRVAETMSIIEQAQGKVIVLVPYRNSIDDIAEAIRTRYTVEIIHGGTKLKDRTRIVQAFQNTPDPHVIVAQPAAISHGLTLTRASVIVWFSCITANGIFQQANERIHRPGQTLSTVVVTMTGTPIEQRMYARLRTKQGVQGSLLQLAREEQR